MTNGNLFLGRQVVRDQNDNIVISGGGSLQVGGTGVVNVGINTIVGQFDGSASNLDVFSGGSFSTGVDLFIGGGDGTIGTVDVFGIGSQLIVNDDVFVQTNSRLDVFDNAFTAILDTLVVSSNGFARVGINNTGGVLAVRNWSVSSPSGINFVSGVIRDLDGITMTATDNLDALRNLTSGKTLQVLGTTTLNGATINLAGGTFLTNSLNQGNGALLWTGGTFVLNGGTVSSGLAVPSLGQLNAAGVITGTLTSAPGSGISATGNLSIDGLFVGGTMSVGAHVATINNPANFLLGSVGTIAAGGELVSPNGVFLNGTLNIGGVVTGRVTASQSSTISATDNISLGDSAISNGFYSNGNISLNNHMVTILDANDVVLDSGAFVDLGSAGTGTLDAANGLTLDFGGNIIGFGTINTVDDLTVPFTNNGHIVGNSLAEPITLTGYVKGVGTCDNCTITGTDAPGFSPAAVNRGSVNYQGTLEIELAGTSPGSQHDQLNHILGAGIVNLGGVLSVALVDGFLPEANDVFEIITATGGVNGMFSTTAEQLPALAGNLEWEINYGANSVVLAVVAAGLPGDYNGNGMIDAADYTVWLAALGSTELLNDPTPGTVDDSDYDYWKANFGATLASASSLTNDLSVPEPISVNIVLVGAVALNCMFLRRL